jgi:translation initiation factor 3 subunit A
LVLNLLLLLLLLLLLPFPLVVVVTLRSPEFTAIGNKAGALNLLHEVLSQRKVRTWAKAYETIMMRYIELCVDLKDHHRGKDGLHQYRNLSQVR